MYEKRFAAIPVQVFTVDGGANGSIPIANTSLFKVKQRVVITATSLTNLELEVKQVASSTVLIVGPIAGSINTFTDLSAYTTALSASIFANEQRRPSIIADDFERAVYEEEPTVAKRVVMVDKFGVIYDDNNPLPATFSGSVAVGDVDQGDPNTLANAWPTKVTDGTDVLVVNSDGSINVNITTVVSNPGLSLTHNEITVVAAATETTILTIVAPPGGKRITKVDVSGDNIANFRVKVNGSTVVNKRTWWTNFNQYFTFEGFENGLLLTAGQTLTITVIHNSTDLGNFEATVMST